jgi:uncharacterized protein (TIGR00725 family)
MVGSERSKRLKVGVIGYSGKVDEPPVSDLASLCLKLGEELGKRYVVFTGGRDGIMELVCKGVDKVNGTAVGILPWDGSDANDYNHLVISTGLDFQMRSFILVKSVDVVISIGGEIGTVVEILASYANKKPVILLRGTGGWTDRISQVLIDGKYLDNRKMAQVYQAWNIDEVLEILESMKL